MKLIAEINEEVQYLKEEKEGKKNYFIEGIFLQSEITNRNGRMYPKNIMAEEVKRYSESYIDKKRAFGELGHPSGPSINLDRTSHLIVSLKESGNDYIGRAKILDTPMGKIVKNLMDEGAVLGVSSRGLGSLREENGKKVVQNDFRLATAADIVADPSAPSAFVQGIMEGVEYEFVNGALVQKTIDTIEHESSKVSGLTEEAKLKIFTDFLNNLWKNHFDK